MEARNPLSCELCSFVGSTDLHLKGHKFRVHNINEDVLFCSDCQYACMSQRGLDLHRSAYCSKAKDVVMVPPFYLKCCVKCAAGLTKQMEWGYTKDKTSRFRTLFICNDCFNVNQPK
jgi:hypothetical protein